MFPAPYFEKMFFDGIKEMREELAKRNEDGKIAYYTIKSCGKYKNLKCRSRGSNSSVSMKKMTLDYGQ